MNQNHGNFNPGDPFGVFSPPADEDSAPVDPKTLGLVWTMTEAGGLWSVPDTAAPLDHAAFIVMLRGEYGAGPAGCEWDDALGILYPANDGGGPVEPPPGGPAQPPRQREASGGTLEAGSAPPASTGPPNLPTSREALALLLAARGLKLVPVHANSKRPIGEDWQRRATSDPTAVASWINAGCNYGIAGGHEISPGRWLVILDCDRPKPGDPNDGLEQLQAFVGSHGEALPRTLMGRSRRGGAHLMLAVPFQPSNSPGALKGFNVDVRGFGGQVVGPGSEMDGQRYTLADDAPIADAPACIANALRVAAASMDRDRPKAIIGELDTPERIERAKAFLRERAPLAVEGQRGDDTTVKRVFMPLFDEGVSVETAHGLLLECEIERDGRRGAWNDLSSPPWEPDALFAKGRSAWNSKEEPVGSKSVEAAAADFSNSVTIETPQPSPPSIMFAGDAAARPLVPWLIDDMLPLVGVGLLAGQSRVGKTFVALNLARAIASGGAFFSRPVRRPGGVLIAAAEAPETLGGRIRALCSHLHPEGAVDPHSLPIAIAAIHSKDQLLPAAKNAAAAIKARFGVPLRLVIVDTVMAAYQLDKEDDAGQVTKAMAHLGGVGRAVGALALGVHHYGKNSERGARGSSAWIASSDTILAATGATDEETGVVKDRRLALVKARDGETGDLAFFDIVGVEIGVDDDGRTRRAGLMQLLGRTKPASARPPTHLAALMDAFEHAAAGDHGIERDGKRFAPEVYARELFDDRVKARFKTPGSSRKAWSDAFRFALDTGRLTKADGLPNCYAAKPRADEDDFASATVIEDPNTR